MYLNVGLYQWFQHGLGMLMCIRMLSVCTGDVITGINDRKVNKAADLAISLDSLNVGDRVTLKVRRGNEGSQVSSSAGPHMHVSLFCEGQSMHGSVF